MLLDEYGGAVEHQSALNLIYLLGLYGSSASGLQPKSHPELSGTDEKWHIRGGNDQLITGLHHRLPQGSVHLDRRLVAVHHHGTGTYTVTFAVGGSIRSVRADHVVLALPFTRLREVDLTGIELPERQVRAIKYQELGANSKIQLQFSRRVWNADHWTGNLYTDEIVQGGWETTIDQPGRPGIMIALPGGAVGADLGRRYRLKTFEGPAPQAMVRDYLRCFETNFPGISAACNGKAYYSWSSGDPHIGGAYSYLKAGAVHQLQRHPGPQERQLAFRRGAHLAGFPGLPRRRPAHRLPLRQRDRRLTTARFADRVPVSRRLDPHFPRVRAHFPRVRAHFPRVARTSLRLRGRKIP